MTTLCLTDLAEIDILGLDLVCSNWATLMRSSYRLIANRSIKETIEDEERRSLNSSFSYIYTHYLYEGIRRRLAPSLTAAAGEGTARGGVVFIGASRALTTSSVALSLSSE